MSKQGSSQSPCFPHSMVLRLEKKAGFQSQDVDLAVWGCGEGGKGSIQGCTHMEACIPIPLPSLPSLLPEKGA